MASFVIAACGLMVGAWLLNAYAVPSNPQPVGIFSDHADFGDWTMAGDATYDPQTGEYVIRGTGGTEENGQIGDYGHVAYIEHSGDFRLKAKISAEELSNAYIGCLDDPQDLEATWYTIWDNQEESLFAAFWRSSYGIPWASSTSISNVLQDGLVEVIRIGNVFTSYYYDRNTGERIEMDTRTIEVSDPIYICLGSESGDYDIYSVAHFSEVELTLSSAVENWNLYK